MKRPEHPVLGPEIFAARLAGRGARDAVRIRGTRAVLSVAQPARDRSVRRRRPDRRPHPHRGRAGEPGARPAARRRKPDRRRRQSRRRTGRAERSRRLHASCRRPGDPRHQQGALQEAQLRSGDRLCLHRHARRDRQCPAGQSGGRSGELAGGADRARKTEARRDCLRLERRGLPHPSHDRDPGAAGRRAASSRALSGRRSADDRPDRRTDRHGVHRDIGRAAAGPVGPVARAGGDHRPAQPVCAERADAGRERISRP